MYIVIIICMVLSLCITEIERSFFLPGLQNNFLHRTDGEINHSLFCYFIISVLHACSVSENQCVYRCMSQHALRT
jgi:hypothetical protein